MYKIFSKIFILILTLFMFGGCAMKKNTAAVRKYKAFTTRYNTYFNGNEAYKEALKGFEDSYQDNYSEMIFMHPVSSLADKDGKGGSAAFDRAIEKSQKCIREFSISKRPVRNPRKAGDPEYKAFLKRTEFNPFLHNAWLLLGKSQYYKGDFLGAYSTFLYTTRHFPWLEETKFECNLWMSKCYTEMGWIYEAENILTKIKEVPPSQQKLYDNAMAGFLLKKGELPSAAPFLETALKSEKNKSQKIRMKYLLAQIYSESGDQAKAYKYYGDVIKSNPDYRTMFNARISQTEVMGNVNYKNIDKKLDKLLRDSRNKEYLDQIYYAKGNLYLNQADTVKAKGFYTLALDKSTRSGMEKCVAAIALGDLCFATEDYIKAQPAYSTAVSILPKEHKEYERISHLSQVLDNLSTHAESVQLQDSLLRLADMTEEARNKVFDNIIADIIKREKEEIERQRKELYDQKKGNYTPPAGADAAATNTPVISNDKSWYFFNTQLVSNGKNDFQRKWGARKPEDNWRRRDKSEIFMDDTESDSYFAENETENQSNDAGSENQAEAGTQQTEDKKGGNSKDVENPKKRDYYIAQVPFTDDEKAVSNQIIEEGLYNMATIFNQQLENLPLAIKTFLDVERRYPETLYLQNIYYEIYLMYMRMENEATANIYKQKLLNHFPESPFSIALKDPDFIRNLREMDSKQNKLYEDTYQAYLDGDTYQVHANYEYVVSKWPLSKLMPNFLFLHALAYVVENDNDAFKSALESLTALYSESQTAPLAGLMIKGISEGRMIAQDNEGVRGMIWNTRLSLGNDSTMMASVTEDKFKVDYDASHLLVLAFATDSIDANNLLFEIAKYNFSNYMIKDFDLELVKFSELSMIIIKGFDNFQEIANYRLRMALPDGFSLFAGITPVMITDNNFRLLMQGKTFDDYFSFINESADAASDSVDIVSDTSEPVMQEETQSEETISQNL